MGADDGEEQGEEQDDLRHCGGGWLCVSRLWKLVSLGLKSVGLLIVAVTCAVIAFLGFTRKCNMTVHGCALHVSRRNVAVNGS